MRRRTYAAVELLPTPPSSPLRRISARDAAPTTTEALLQEARAGTAAARGILSTAHETHAVARHTADALQRQTAQLEAVAGHVRDTEEALAGAEDNIEKLTKPFWRRGGRSRRGRPGEAARMGKSGRAEERRNVVVGGAVKEDREEAYAEFDEAVRGELRIQDEILEETGVVVEELRVLAVGIGEEVEKEAEIVEGIDVVEVTSRIREGNRKLRHRLKLK